MQRIKLALALLVASCGIQQSPMITAKPTQDQAFKDAIRYVWNDCYRMPGMPHVRFVGGLQLTCNDPNSGKRGFDCPTVGCREGCTGLDSVVSIHGEPPSQTALAHELRHQYHTLRGILPDFNHKLPDWNPGGIVDFCNSELAERGL